MNQTFKIVVKLLKATIASGLAILILPRLLTAMYSLTRVYTVNDVPSRPVAIVLDYAGRRTYDTCFRAHAIFGIRQAILVTQSFHLPRALYTCNALGLEAIGVASDQRNYRTGSIIYWHLRELPATLTALLDVHLLKPLPVLGG